MVDERDDSDHQNEPLMGKHPAQPIFVPISKTRPIFLGPTVKLAAVLPFFFRFRAQKPGAHHWRKRQRNEGGYTDGHAKGNGELAE